MSVSSAPIFWQALWQGQGHLGSDCASHTLVDRGNVFWASQEDKLSPSCSWLLQFNNVNLGFWLRTHVSKGAVEGT